MILVAFVTVLKMLAGAAAAMLASVVVPRAHSRSATTLMAAFVGLKMQSILVSSMFFLMLRANVWMTAAAGVTMLRVLEVMSTTVLMMPRAYAMRVVGVSAEAIMAIVVPST